MEKRTVSILVGGKEKVKYGLSDGEGWRESGRNGKKGMGRERRGVMGRRKSILKSKKRRREYVRGREEGKRRPDSSLESSG